MYAIRPIVYAEAQARIRARVGSMPDANAWRRLAAETDLDQLIERMRSQGLWYWVAGLPRQPDTASIEIHLQERLIERATVLAAWLPPPWAQVQAWIRIGLGLFLVRSVLIDPAVGGCRTMPTKYCGARPAFHRNSVPRLWQPVPTPVI